MTTEIIVQLTVSSRPQSPGISSISWKKMGNIPTQRVLMATEAKYER